MLKDCFAIHLFLLCFFFLLQSQDIVFLVIEFWELIPVVYDEIEYLWTGAKDISDVLVGPTNLEIFVAVKPHHP